MAAAAAAVMVTWTAAWASSTSVVWCAVVEVGEKFTDVFGPARRDAANAVSPRATMGDCATYVRFVSGDEQIDQVVIRRHSPRDPIDLQL